ncbi:MAG: hypothetical protein JWM02_1840 [Frankiales bacterium]|nr:hypothetical protein [Frankiales bacterium]
MSIGLSTNGGGTPSRLSSHRSRLDWLVLLVPLIAVPAVCVAVLVLAAAREPVEQLAIAFLAAAAVVMLLAPRGVVSARTWVVGYLVVQFPIRGLFLLTAPKERPPIYAEFSPGVGLEGALGQALLQSLIGLGVLTAAYLLALPRGVASRPVISAAGIRTWRVLVLLGVAGLLLPLEIHSAGGGFAVGGGFMLSLPGLMASGAAAAVCYAFVQAPRQHLITLVPALAYTAARVSLLGSKMAVLACVVAFVIGLTGRAQTRRPGRSHAFAGLAVILVGGLVGTYIFALASGGNRKQGVVDSVSGGVSAAISRSYGVDALMASNAHLEAGAAQLHGSTFVELAYSWVPRALWPEKPKSFSIRFGEDVFSFSPSAGKEFFAPSYSGEWVLNFGTIGLLVGWMLFGLALGRVDAIPSLAHRTLWLVSMVHLVEGSLVAQFWLAAPFVAGGYWVLRRQQRASGPVPARHVPRVN